MTRHLAAVGNYNWGSGISTEFKHEIGLEMPISGRCGMAMKRYLKSLRNDGHIVYSAPKIDRMLRSYIGGARLHGQSKDGEILKVTSLKFQDERDAHSLFEASTAQLLSSGTVEYIPSATEGSAIKAKSLASKNGDVAIAVFAAYGSCIEVRITHAGQNADAQKATQLAKELCNYLHRE